jgi:hypothetical protein
MNHRSQGVDLAARLEAIREILFAHFKAGKSLPSATVGAERETLVREFLSRVLPRQVRFGSGAILDSRGRSTGQIDVVLEFPFGPSFPTPATDDRVYLADSVAVALEVKSNLDQWGEICRSASRVNELARSWIGHCSILPDGHVKAFGPTGSWIPFIAVAYRGPKTGSKLRKRIEHTPNARIDAVFVIESGAYSGCALSGSPPCEQAGGVLAFASDLAWLATNVLAAVPNTHGYVAQLDRRR